MNVSAAMTISFGRWRRRYERTASRASPHPGDLPRARLSTGEERVEVLDRGAPLVLGHVVGPLGDDAPRRAAVVAVALRVPYRDGVHVGLQHAVVVVHHVGTTVDPGELVGSHAFEQAHHV